ncbi:hypothetical protein Ddc_16374 [Ditylenchus destructor]|nr:hypothetical protein Ddc_16374 [Ditylenchus destructor]
MLCLRRISLDAKSRLLFLSRSHSSTNDSMPKSTAISRLIHKKFLQQNGNNSPQAIFVFFQQRRLWILKVQPVLEEKHKSAEDKDEKDKSEQRGVRTKVPEDTDKSAEEKEKSADENEKSSGDKEKSSGEEKSDAKAPEDGSEFKFGFGPSGTKPKNKWEKDFYRFLHKDFKKSGKSEEEFEKKLKEFNPDKIGQFLLCFGGVVLAFTMYTAGTVFERYHNLKSKVPEPQDIFEKNFYMLLHKYHGKMAEEEFEKYLKKVDPEKARRRRVFILGAGVVLAVGMYIVGMARGSQILRTQVLKGNDKSVRRFFFYLGGVIFAFTMFTVGTIFERYRIWRNKVSEDKSKFADDQDDSDARDSEDEFKFGFGPSGAKPKNEFEKDLYRRIHKGYTKKWGRKVEKYLKSNECKTRVRLFGLVCNVVLALLIAFTMHSFIVSTMFVGLSELMSNLLFTVLYALSYFGVQAFSTMTVLLEYDMKSRSK